MTCETARTLLHPYADGELDLLRSLDVEEHLRGCAECSREATALRALRAVIGAAAHFYTAPPGLEAQVRAMASAEPSRPERDRHLPFFGWGLIAAAAVVALVAIGLKRGPFAPPDPTEVIPTEVLAREVLADHVRSLMASHLTDVVSANQHTVKPWFEGKIDFSPTVDDLTPQGFTLVGGRLDFLAHRPVAAIVYKRRAHVINLFVWPAPHASDAAPAQETDDGYNLVHWVRSGMTYWAVSSLNGAELDEFVADLIAPESRVSPSAN